MLYGYPSTFLPNNAEAETAATRANKYLSAPLISFDIRGDLLLGTYKCIMACATCSNIATSDDNRVWRRDERLGGKNLHVLASQAQEGRPQR